MSACATAILAVIFLFAPWASKGQQKSDEDARFSTDARLVILPVTVQDKNGHLVTTLPQSSFQVYENGVLQPIKTFKREDVPVSLGLIIDNSGSMRDKRQKVESASLALVKDSNPEDEVFIVNFNDEAFLDQDFTNNIKEMEQGLTKIDSRGGTAMRDAIRMSIDHLKEKGKKDKKVLLVVTDGNDNASIVSLENLVRASQQSEVILYAIGLLSDEERREANRAKRALTALTDATGGQVYFPKEVSEVDRIAHQVARDIRNQYTIGYSPLNAALDGSYRTVKVIATGPNKLTVRTRSGYYATGDKTNISASSPPKQ
ncbi:MAG: VWA domain-containing protein [Acidobacteriota bacterium]|nr:VWA domain-containing protein [Acidobacteriota bacterium]